MQTITVQDLCDARDFVAEQLQVRAFAEHPEDRDELIHKYQILNQHVENMSYKGTLVINPEWHVLVPLY